MLMQDKAFPLAIPFIALNLFHNPWIAKTNVPEKFQKPIVAIIVPNSCYYSSWGQHEYLVSFATLRAY